MSVAPRPRVFVAFALLASVLLSPSRATAATANFPEFTDPNPNPGNQFGFSVLVLPGGNVAVTSPFDDFNGTDAGAVYVFDGSTGALISTLRGAQAGDRVGSAGLVALASGNFVAISPHWQNGAVPDAGAVTFCSASTALSRIVGSSNSLVGATANDGPSGMVALPNGNYAVNWSSWDNGAIVDAGAVTWGNGSTGVSGFVSAANSLVGSSASDRVGSGGLTTLTNSNFVVSSPGWSNGATADVGAVTWCSGTAATTGAVTSANSLVGSTALDAISSGFVKALTNGNYVVPSPGWDNGSIVNAGAVTWCNGTTGRVGTVSAANSLVGSNIGDVVGSVAILSNGNYVVTAPNWDNGAITGAGAATWCNGTTGLAGTISAANSLVGSTASDQVGSFGVCALTNGNYVVLSPGWNNGALAGAGAATWGSGTAGVKGIVTASNSLVGTTAFDNVGRSCLTLTNGNFVVASPFWSNGAISSVGAVTWGNGATGRSGAVSAANSLVGTTAFDNVGVAVPLKNGHYVVRSNQWDNGAVTNAGAVTWCNGTTGRTGAVSAANSLVGTTADDNVGGGGVLALANGHYVVRTNLWDKGGITNAGAVTWANGNTGLVGSVSAANSLVGSSVNDGLGGSSVTELANGNFVVAASKWDRGALSDAGAVRLCNGNGGDAGELSPSNSIVGRKSGDQVGGVFVMANGDYVVHNAQADLGGHTNSGAARYASGTIAESGELTEDNATFSLADNATAVITPDNVHGTFLAASYTEGSGHVRVGPNVPFTLASVTDVPADQGGSVYVTFNRLFLDHPFGNPAAMTYGVWRKLPGTLAAARALPLLAKPLEPAALAAIRATLPEELAASEVNGTLVVSSTVRAPASPNYAMPAGTWALVATVPAFQQNQYLAVALTVSNLAPNEFVVTGHTATPALWFATNVVSGQSVDNLAPAAPQSFAGAYATGNTHLTWAPNGEGDIGGYRLYRGTSTGFTPSLANRIGTPAGTVFDDAITGGFVYKLTAVDVNGNESPVAMVIPTGTSSVNDGPVAFALDGVRPNPASGRELQIAFALPNGAPARLELLDVTGRRIAVRDVGGMGAGRHAVNLAEARAIPAGLYWARLTQGAQRRSVRVAVVE